MGRARGTMGEAGVYPNMSGKSSSRRADRIIAALAGRQNGVVARWQLLREGVTGHQIDWRLSTGRLHQIHQGVYLVGHAVPPPLAMERAALLAYRNRAVLGGRTATNLWKLLPHPATAPVCVVVPPERNARRPGIHAREARLDRQDIRSHDGLPLTSPPRTILDLSLELDSYKLEQLVAEAQFRHLASDRELRSQLERNPGKRGAARLHSVLDLPGGPQRTRSPGEVAMLKLLRKAGITGFKANARIHGYEVDFLWRDLGFAVEVEGYDGHSGRHAFERDRLKWARLQAKGVQVMPVTGRQISQDAEGVAARIREALALRGS
jgi:very-short-patch-repair endonuclease